MQEVWANSSGAVSYFKKIRRFPMLKAEKELKLVACWRERGDEGAAHQVLTSHLRFVAKIARGYRGYGLPTSDLISEGNIGLLHALERFDADRGVRFSTYAALVDQGSNSGLHPAIMVARENGHDSQSAKVVF